MKWLFINSTLALALMVMGVALTTEAHAQDGCVPDGPSGGSGGFGGASGFDGPGGFGGGSGGIRGYKPQPPICPDDDVPPRPRPWWDEPAPPFPWPPDDVGRELSATEAHPQNYVIWQLWTYTASVMVRTNDGKTTAIECRDGVVFATQADASRAARAELLTDFRVVAVRRIIIHGDAR